MKASTKPARLPVAEFEEIKHEVRQCWRMLGMLHLRMHNDMNTKKGKAIPAHEIQERIWEVKARLEKLEQLFLSCAAEDQA
ncbi:hypothetical protein LJC56_06625 [Christensenellaceae bacterium OttesenSCG-928-K19]|nr:hypothetical protein [Christensenellaceae bacterium OttesenSCG-928-K19]